MLQFLKDSIREFRHVVWPTRKETQKFFGLVLALLTFFAVYLFLVSNIFSEIVFALKNTFGTNNGSAVSSSLSDEEIDALFSNEAIITTTSSTGEISTGSVSTETATGAAQ